jgi:hypothetical protein
MSDYEYVDTYLSENDDAILTVYVTKHGMTGRVMAGTVEMATDTCDTLDALLQSLSEQLEDD